MRKTIWFILALLILSLALAACGGGGDETAGTDEQTVGDVANGESLYKQPVIGTANAPGCSTCHSLEPGVVVVGPSHDGVGTRAATYVAGVSAEDYLRESIITPNAHIVEGFVEGVMYQNYAAELTETEIDDLVAYLLTLK